MDVSNSQKKKDHFKKPLNAYFLWSRIFRSKVMEQNPDITVCQVNALLGKIWRAMSAEQKEPYFKESERMKTQYKVDFPEIHSNLKPHDKQPETTNDEAFIKFPELGDSHFRSNRLYQMSQMVSIPNGHLQMTHNNIHKTRAAFYTPYNISNRMSSYPQQLYMNAKARTQTPTGYNGYLPQWSMVPGYPSQHHSVEYANLQQRDGRIHQSCLYKSAPFEVPSTQGTYFANHLAPENSTYRNAIFIQQPASVPFINAHLYGVQSRCDPVVMTNCLHNTKEITLPPILSKANGISGTLLHIPEQNRAYFEQGYDGLGHGVSDLRIPENFQTFPSSQPGDQTIENTQLLVEDPRRQICTQICNSDLLGNQNYQHAPTSQQVYKENRPITFSDIGILGVGGGVVHQPDEQHSNQSSDILKTYESDISNDKDYRYEDDDTEGLGDLVSCFWLDEDFASSNIEHEEEK